MQVIVNIRLPPGINFGISLKWSEITQIGYLWSPLDSYSINLTTKIKSGTSHIAHHTSHITYYIGICKFYKILVINTVVTFKNSSKLILKTFDEYFLMEIITLTIQTPMASLKSVKPTISRWNKALSEKFGLAQKSWKNLRLVFFLQKWLKKIPHTGDKASLDRCR